MGRRARKVVEDFQQNPPSPEMTAKMGSDLRVVGHAFIRAARRVEEGDHMAVGELIANETVNRLLMNMVTADVIAGVLAAELRRADAEDN
jgi:hypothetical protein